MKLRYVTGLAAGCLAAALLVQPVMAKARDCAAGTVCIDKKVKKSTGIVLRVKSTGPRYVWDKRTRKWVAQNRVTGQRYVASRRGGSPAVLPAARQQVVALIKQMAPSYGVPTWFALRIAKVESGYNPRARGRAGEYGVFQLKCATARGIGFRGKCGSLLSASVNVQYGLRHLQMAVRSSRGNLKLAASKHNGGLGRKRLVRAYVNRVF